MTAAIHAIYQNGVFRPTQPVDLPDRCEVEVDIRSFKTEPERPSLDDVYAILNARFDSGEHDVAARHNELGIESNLGDELRAVWEACREPNWDGYGALPVCQDALRNSRLFLDSLPPGVPPPSIGAEPDGAITLEWHCSARRTLSVSVSAGDELHYAALVGPNRVYGTEAFFGEVPEPIVGLISRVLAA